MRTKGWTLRAALPPVSLGDHKERVNHDLTSNILACLRQGITLDGRQLAMDSMIYHYTASANRLNSISGQIDTVNYTEDSDATH